MRKVFIIGGSGKVARRLGIIIELTEGGTPVAESVARLTRA